MARKFYTIFILPHARSRFRKIHLSRNFLVAVGLVVGLLAAAGLATPHLWLKLQVRSERLEALSTENAALRAEKEEFEDSLAQLGQRLNSFESEAGRLAQALGLDEAPGIDAAAGGSPVAPGHGVQGMLEEELGALDLRARALGSSLEDLTDAWQERERLMASTPNTLPVRGWFSDGFGWRKDPITGRREFHRGLDIVAPLGAVVRAPADGVITRSGRQSGYGKMVDLAHGYGYSTRYGHLSEVLVKAGQRVRRGDALGRVGSTGRSTGPHLHYEVFKEGRRENPWKYLDGRP